MLTETEKEQIQKIVNESLDKAEQHWNDGGYLLEEKTAGLEDINLEAKRESESSEIPGYPVVQDDETKIDEFIALVMDMRDSSKHLMENIASAKVTELQRIYYETSALLPAVDQTIKFQNGGVTEYLGDGVLAFFKIEEDKDESVRTAYRVAKNIIDDTRKIVNSILEKRYNLPPLDIGVGLAASKALISLVGLQGEKKHPKAFGKCVFRATKLSSGKNQIYIDAVLKDMWPTAPRGILNFKPQSIKGIDGYLI